jgi:uncharacterized protein YwqG
MAKDDDLTSLSDDELVEAYAEIAHLFETSEHVGRANRLMGRFMPIIDELRARSGGTFQMLRPLLEHVEPSVRYSVAQRFSELDHEAYERTMRPLAERADEIGRKAQGSLRLDAYYQKVGYPEARQQSPTVVRGLPKKLQWQCDNPPVEAMPFADIERRLAKAFPAAIAKRLMGLARPTIGLWPQRHSENLPPDASRLGGMPYAPGNWSWPMFQTEPMLFIGHINCTALQSFPGSERLASSGLVSFFGDHDTVIGAGGGGGAVFHFPDIDRLAPAEPPIELTQVFPQCPLSFRQVVDLPDPYCNIVQSILKDQKQISDYGKVCDVVRYHGIPDEVRHHCGLSKLFGWPSLVQMHDLDEPDTNKLKGHRLLLQVDEYSNGEESEGWGPGGSLYFMTPARDLLDARFDRSQLEMQCT